MDNSRSSRSVFLDYSKTEPPIPVISPLKKALRGFTQSFSVRLLDDGDPAIQLNETRVCVYKMLRSKLREMKGFKYVETLEVTLSKRVEKGAIYVKGKSPSTVASTKPTATTYRTAFFNSKVATVINRRDMYDTVQKAGEDIHNRIDIWLSEGSGWTIDKIKSHHIKIRTFPRL